MGNKIVPIRGGAVVEVLEDLLAQARRGELVSISFACVLADGATAEGWSGDYDVDVVKMYGAIGILVNAYFHSCIEHDGIADRMHDT